MNILDYLYGPYFEKEAAFNMSKFQAALGKYHTRSLLKDPRSGIMGHDYLNRITQSMRKKIPTRFEKGVSGKLVHTERYKRVMRGVDRLDEARHRQLGSGKI